MAYLFEFYWCFQYTNAFEFSTFCHSISFIFVFVEFHFVSLHFSFSLCSSSSAVCSDNFVQLKIIGQNSSPVAFWFYPRHFFQFLLLDYYFDRISFCRIFSMLPSTSLFLGCDGISCLRCSITRVRTLNNSTCVTVVPNSQLKTIEIFGKHRKVVMKKNDVWNNGRGKAEWTYTNGWWWWCQDVLPSFSVVLLVCAIDLPAEERKQQKWVTTLSNVLIWIAGIRASSNQQHNDKTFDTSEEDEMEKVNTEFGMSIILLWLFHQSKLSFRVSYYFSTKNGFSKFSIIFNFLEYLQFNICRRSLCHLFQFSSFSRCCGKSNFNSICEHVTQISTHMRAWQSERRRNAEE